MKFQLIDSQTRFEGRIVTLKENRYRYADGGEADREIIEHGGAVAAVVHDGQQLFLVRQPREATGEPDMLELPAGKLDVEGEAPEDAMRRELVEEIGKSAGSWEHLHSFYTSVGFSNEKVWVYLATDLADVDDFEPDPEERIEIVTWPLADLDNLIDQVQDSKTLIGLYAFRRTWES
jgi:ADP-ribose pyrophosphatase